MMNTVSERSPSPEPLLVGAVDPHRFNLDQVAIDLTDSGRQALATLAMLAASGNARPMEEELAYVSRNPHDAAQSLQEQSCVTSLPRWMARRAALDVHRLRLHLPGLKPTPAAQAVLGRDEAYLNLRRHLWFNNDPQDFRNLQFHVIGRLARLAAGR